MIEQAASMEGFYRLSFAARHAQNGQTIMRSPLSQRVAAFEKKTARCSAAARLKMLLPSIEWTGVEARLTGRSAIVFEVKEAQLQQLFPPGLFGKVSGKVVDDLALIAPPYHHLAGAIVLIPVGLPEKERTLILMHEIAHVDHWELPNSRLFKETITALNDLKKTAQEEGVSASTAKKRALLLMQSIGAYLIDEASAVLSSCQTVYDDRALDDGVASEIIQELLNSTQSAAALGFQLDAIRQGIRDARLKGQISAFEAQSTRVFYQCIRNAISSLRQFHTQFGTLGVLSEALQVVTFDELFSNLESVARDVVIPKRGTQSLGSLFAGFLATKGKG